MNIFLGGDENVKIFDFIKEFPSDYIEPTCYSCSEMNSEIKYEL